MTSNFSQLSTDALSPGQLPESVKALLKRAHINRYPKRTTIVDAGTESKSLYLIFSVHDKFHRTLILSGFCL
ncbi:hypothetical protein RFG21_17760, partial [Acinetobacter baumannii]|nr:hypothetical protein [Acinetobacter baumannii]